jgi:hypothetical protein
LVQACLNYCTKALTRFIRLKEAFAGRIEGLKLIVVKKVKLKKDIGKDRLDLACVSKVEPHKCFNTAALTYILTRLARFKGSLGAKELRSNLTDFIKSAEELNNKKLSLSRYV